MFQRIQLVGRVGQDPEARFTASGTMVVNFSVATTEKISKERTPDCPNGWKESYGQRQMSPYRFEESYEPMARPAVS